MSKDKMTDTPWVAGGSFPYKGNEGYIFATSMRPEILVCKTFGSIDENTPPLGEQMENSKAIVCAVNNTYGQSINPEAVPDMLAALNKCLEYFHYQNNHSGATPVAVATAVRKAKLNP
jgi:hypothetical protein